MCSGNRGCTTDQCAFGTIKSTSFTSLLLMESRTCYWMALFVISYKSWKTRSKILIQFCILFFKITQINNSHLISMSTCLSKSTRRNSQVFSVKVDINSLLQGKNYRILKDLTCKHCWTRYGKNLQIKLCNFSKVCGYVVEEGTDYSSDNESESQNEIQVG